MAKSETCTHVDQISNPKPNAKGCGDCLKTGDTWVELRLCESCGHVDCCDSSKNTHATKHFKSSHHPIIKSFEPGEDWGWCYVDQVYVETDWPIDGPAYHSPAADAHLDF